MLPWREHERRKRTRYSLDCFPTSQDYLIQPRTVHVNYIGTIWMLCSTLKTRGVKMTPNE